MTKAAWVQIKRDPFARSTLMRIKETSKCECAWCGSPAKWRYRRQADACSGWSLSPWGDDGKRFCGIGCFRTYYRKDVKNEPRGADHVGGVGITHDLDV